MRFFLGDDNGQLKSVSCTKSLEKEWTVDAKVLDDGGKQGKARAVQRLAVKGDMVALGRGDGSTTLFSIQEDAESAQVVQQWQEARFKQEHQYVGLNITDDGVISCTSAGHLRLTSTGPGTDAGTSSQTTSIPSRLSDWVLSDDGKFFAYGGDEVEVSMWDTSRAFDPSRRLLPNSATGTKRRNGQSSELIEGETWRAKNVSNDFLNLRQPVNNTSLAYLSSITDGKELSHHILAGTGLGSVRRYDTRVARKPVADWKEVAKVGGIQKVQRGNSQHEAFVADHGSNLFALDLRTGRVLYAYNGIAGTISSIARTTSSLSPPLFASSSLDRFFRLHSAYPPPQKSSAPMDRKGEVLVKVWVKSAAGCVAWDGRVADEPVDDQEVDEGDGEEGDVWAGMEDVGDEDSANSSENDGQARKNKKRKTR